MKKSIDKTLQRRIVRKLVLRGETIALLTPIQLSNIVSGDGSGVVCTTVQSKEETC